MLKKDAATEWCVKTCPSCGRTENEVPFIGFLCRDCYLKRNPPVKETSFEVKICPTCGRIMLGRWTEFSLSALASWLKRKIKIAEEVVDPQITVTLSEKEECIEYRAVLTGRIEGTPFTYRFSGCIFFKKEQCPICARRAGEYYEAVIQFRGAQWEKLYRMFLTWISSQQDPMAFITKEVRRKKGLDVYLGSKKVAEKFSRRAKQMGATVKTSFSLVTVRDGKPITREYLSLRLD